MKGNKGLKLIVFVLAGLLLVNYIGSFKFGRIDLTEEKIHSLSPKTLEVLSSDSLIKDELKFEVYLTGDLPPELRKLKLAIKEKLDEFRAYGGDKIYYEFINPSDNSDTEEDVKKQLQEQGLQPTIISTFSDDSKKDMIVFGGIMLRSPTKPLPEPIQLLQPSFRPVQVPVNAINEIINNLEYSLLEGIYKVTTPSRKRIGFLKGHGELQGAEIADITYELSKFHVVEELSIDGKIKALDKLDALVIAKPTMPIPDKDQFIIDQFIMNGGKVAWLIDPVDVSLDSLYMRGESIGLAYELNGIEKQIFNYGVRVNKDLVIDANSAYLYLKQGTERYNWFYYPWIKTDIVDNLIVNNVDPILFRYTSSIDILKNEEVKTTPLLYSSELSMTYKIPVRINFNMLSVEPEMIANAATPHRLLAVMLEGDFNSYFRNRMSERFANESGYTPKNRIENSKMLVISDGDLIRNEVDSIPNRQGQNIARPLNLNRDRFDSRINFGNREFFVNAIESLLGTEDLIPLRSKSITQRPLNPTKIKADKRYWQMLNVVMPVLVVLIFGMFYFMYRKRKYAK